MAKITYVSLTISMVSATSEVTKKKCQDALKAIHESTQDWDEVRDPSGKIIALIVFVDQAHLDAAVAALQAVPGVAYVLVGDTSEAAGIVSLPPNTTVSGTISVSTVPSDEFKKKVASVDYVIDSEIGVKRPPFTTQIDTASLADGSHEFRAVLRDKKQNVLGLSAPVPFTVANGSPSNPAIGWDATAAGLQKLLDAGWAEYPVSYADPAITYDGVAKTATLADPVAGAGMGINLVSPGGILPQGVGYKASFSCQPIVPAGATDILAYFSFNFSNDLYSPSPYIMYNPPQTGIDGWALWVYDNVSGAAYAVAIGDTNLHTYDMSVSDSGLMVIKKDTVVVMTEQLATGSVGNFIEMIIIDSPSANVSFLTKGFSAGAL